MVNERNIYLKGLKSGKESKLKCGNVAHITTFSVGEKRISVAGQADGLRFVFDMSDDSQSFCLKVRAHHKPASPLKM